MIFKNSAHRKTGIKLILCTWFLYSAQACVMPHLTRYYDLDLGLADWQIGCLMAFPALFLMAAQPTWGIIADRYLGRTLTFRIVLTIGAVLLTLFAFAYQWGGYVFLLIAAMLMRSCFGSTAPLHSSLVFAFLGRDNGSLFGRIRVFGSISFMLTMFLICPWIVQWSTQLGFQGRELLFIATALLYLLTIFTTFWDDSQFDPQERPEFRSFFSLAQNPSIVILYISLFLTSIGASAGIQYIGPYVGYRGFSENFYSLLWFTGVGVEVFLTFYLHRIVQKIGIKKTIALGFLCEGIRWLGMWFFDSHIVILLLFGLHGPAVIALFFASAIFVDKECNYSIRSTAQAMLFFSIMFGQVTGFIGGSFIVSLYHELERVDAIRSSFLWYGIFAVTGSLIFILFVPRKQYT